MKIDEQVKVAIDHIGVHVVGPHLDIMLHFGLFEAMKLKQGKPATGHIVVEIKEAKREEPPAPPPVDMLPTVP